MPEGSQSQWTEDERLLALRHYHILDTPREQDFDDIAKLAAQICDAPISLVNFVADSRQWFKATVGTEWTETPRDISVCTHAILQKDVFVVPDTTLDERFRNNPLVTGDPHLRFYAGALLETPEGLPIGTMCVLDYEPREFSEQQKFALKTLARQVMLQLELRQALREQRKTADEILDSRQKLLANNLSLEQRVKERTAQLQETIAEIESFSYSISHDLRAPLRAMQSFAECLEDECRDLVPPAGQDYIRRIVKASSRMDRLIQDVLIYSGLGRGEVTMEPIYAGRMLHDVIESDFHDVGKSANIEVKDIIPPVWANEALLIQCFTNLIGNAIKFVDPSIQPHIQIGLRRENGRVQIDFRDNGIGIDSDHLDRIFGLFHQINPATGSTGIGLAVARKAAERMGGTLSVVSAPGAGSTFTLDLKSVE